MQAEALPQAAAPAHRRGTAGRLERALIALAGGEGARVWSTALTVASATSRPGRANS